MFCSVIFWIELYIENMSCFVKKTNYLWVNKMIHLSIFIRLNEFWKKRYLVLWMTKIIYLFSKRFSFFLSICVQVTMKKVGDGFHTVTKSEKFGEINWTENYTDDGVTFVSYIVWGQVRLGWVRISLMRSTGPRSTLELIVYLLFELRLGSFNGWL